MFGQAASSHTVYELGRASARGSRGSRGDSAPSPGSRPACAGPACPAGAPSPDGGRVLGRLPTFPRGEGVASPSPSGRLGADALHRHGSDVDGAAVGVKHRLVHHLRQRRVREDRVHQLGLGRSPASARCRKPWISSVTSAPIMCAPSSSPVLASNTVLTRPSGSPSAIALPLPMKGNRPTLTSRPAALAARLGQADARHLRPAIGAARNLRGVERMDAFHAGDLLDADHALVHSPCARARAARRDRRWRRRRARRCRTTRRPRRGVFSTFTPVPSRPMFSTLPTMPTARITRSTVASLVLPPGLDRGRHVARALLQAFHRRAGDDLHALLLERLAREGRDLFVLDGQDAVEHLDHRHLGAERAIEAGELDADRAGADDQQRFRQRLRHHRFLVGPDQLAVGLQARQRARPRAGREDDVLRLHIGDRLAVLLVPRACPLPASFAWPSSTATLFFFRRPLTPLRQLPGDLARALDDLRQVEA